MRFLISADKNKLPSTFLGTVTFRSAPGTTEDRRLGKHRPLKGLGGERRSDIWLLIGGCESEKEVARRDRRTKDPERILDATRKAAQGSSCIAQRNQLLERLRAEPTRRASVYSCSPRINTTGSEKREDLSARSSAMTCIRRLVSVISDNDVCHESGAFGEHVGGNLFFGL